VVFGVGFVDLPSRSPKHFPSLFPGFLDDLVGVTLGKIHELIVPVDGFFKKIHFLGRHVMHHVATFAPRLVVIIGTVTHPTQRTPLHPLDPRHVF
jgi:hypothetical protein